jgi:hypothetical protein
MVICYQSAFHHISDHSFRHRSAPSVALACSMISMTSARILYTRTRHENETNCFSNVWYDNTKVSLRLDCRTPTSYMLTDRRAPMLSNLLIKRRNSCTSGYLPFLAILMSSLSSSMAQYSKLSLLTF